VALLPVRWATDGICTKGLPPILHDALERLWSWRALHHVSRKTIETTDGSSDTPDSSSNMINAFWRHAGFSCGQRCWTQRWIASSLRSVARQAGRCQLQCNSWRRRY
jgi:hypothetical protein